MRLMFCSYCLSHTSNKIHFAVMVLNIHLCIDIYLSGISDFLHVFAISSTDCPKTAGNRVEYFEHSMIWVIGHTKQ